MIEQQGQSADQTYERRRRRAGIVAFLVGLVATLAFFAFFPGLPHVIDWGAILLSLAVGGLARGACRSWMARAAKKKADRM
jgi:ABC-type antimicrobial peptide transport system permease subunit